MLSNLRYIFGITALIVLLSCNSVYSSCYSPFKSNFNAINDKKPVFGFFTGDIVPVSSQKNWKMVKNDLADLNCPVYFAPGNHDMGNRSLYVKINPNPDTVLTKRKDVFVTLDNTKYGWGLDTSQLSLLDSALKLLNDNSNLFLFVHNVSWYTLNDCFTPNSKAGLAPEPFMNFYNTVIPKLEQLQNNIYLFAGDVGATSTSKNIGYLKKKNLHYITSGMGNGINDNFLFITVNNENVSVDVIPLSGDKKKPIQFYSCE